MVSVENLAGLVLLVAMGSLGVAVLRRAGLGLEPLEQAAYGFPLGVVAASLVLLPPAVVVGFGGALVAVVGVAAAAGAAWLWPAQRAWSVGSRSLRASQPVGLIAGSPLGPTLRDVRTRISLGPTLTIGAFVLLWMVFHAGAMTREADGLWASQQHLWSDWGVHLGHTTSFAYGDNFPPENPFVAGLPFAYHYLSSLTAAAMVELGMDPVAALKLHGFVLTTAITLGLYAFARRLTRDRAAAALALTLFLLGSGLGWVLTVAEVNRSHDLLGTLWDRPWDYQQRIAAEFRWEPSFLVAIAPTRGFLYGLPLAMLTLTLLLIAVRRGAEPGTGEGTGEVKAATRRRLPLPPSVRTIEGRAFVAAGIVAGLLPFAHLGTLLALALITPFLVLLFPRRFWGWAVFFGVWAFLAVPQVLLQQGGGSGAAGGIHRHIGWVARDDSIVWFWLKNMGLFLPLLAFALADRRLAPSVERRFLWACMPAFVFTNLVSFQPVEWDNLKVLEYWFLAVSVLVGALLVRTWREHRAPVVRALVAGVVLSLTLSGVLMHWHQIRGLDTYQLLADEERRLAEEVRAKTPPRAVFAVGLQQNHPVSMLAGRRTLLFFPGYVYSWGIDYAERERDLRAIYAFAPGTPELLRKHGIDYVVIGWGERRDLGANVGAFQQRYPVVIDTGGYQVFAVSDAAVARATGAASGG